ncbi:MAG: magnesium-translocating P-type ATPase, partial [Candidatus Anstonellales archaeon]
IWSLEANALLAELASSPYGLSEKEAKNRLEKYGPNIIPDKDRRNSQEILLSQLKTPPILILLFGCLISIFLGDLLDSLVIFLLILASVVFGFFQEYKAEKVLSELKKYYSYKATVIRGGKKFQISSSELVPGDVVSVGLGDIVPADLRILESRSGIIVDQSILTGESRPVEKNVRPSPPSSNTPQEISNGLFMGTTILEGYAIGVVVFTGNNTFFGKTTAVFSSRVPESDFQISVRKFGFMLMKLMAAITLFVFITNYLAGHGEKNPLLDSALFALALAVGITPEALPAIITIALSVGSLKLAKNKVVTKKLAAIEDLGNMDVLCTDKTGTLTEEGLRFFKYVDLDMQDNHDVFEYALLCNSAVGSTRIRGNPIDIAIKKEGKKAGADISRFEKLYEIPFDFKRKRMSVIVKEGAKKYIITKGAPESVLDVCSRIKMKSTVLPVEKKKEEVLNAISQYTKDGLSTIGVAYSEIESKSDYSLHDEKNLIFIGFVLFSNPPKATASHAIKRLNQLNIQVKILTGDDPNVTRKLCNDIGLPLKDNRIILGSEISEMSEKELLEAVEKYDVFARVTPDQKLKIVEALRSNGHVVGFLGDGINDAPALRAADVGISVDTAADVAKGASHIILLQKSLDIISEGVEEGRKIFGNIFKYVRYTVSANLGNMLTVSLSSVILPFIPLLPSQILLTNLISDVPMFAISTDNVDSSYTKKPQRWDNSLIFRFMLFFGLISSFFDVLLILLMLLFLNTPVSQFRTSWFLLSILTEITIIFSLRTTLPAWKSQPSLSLIITSLFAIILTFAFIYTPITAEIFRFSPPNPTLLLIILFLVLVYFVTNEIGKKVFFTFFSNKYNKTE